MESAVLSPRNTTSSKGENMFLSVTGWAARGALVLLVLAIMAGCAAQPASQQASPTAPVAPPGATPAGGGAANPAPLDGTWKGAISIGGQELGIQLNFAGQGGTIDIPAQGAKGLRIENFSVQGNQVAFEMLPAPQTAKFSGTVDGDKMGGAFEQAGYKGTWEATREAAASAAPTADASKSYTDEEVTFKNGQYTLAGTLSLPKGAGPHPAIVLISGSGQQNRDEEIFGFKPFAILADALAKQSVAVLRYDDRGIGGSTTGTVDDTSETYAADVEAAYDYLKTRSEIDPKKIGLLGHSEGGIIAPMVAVDKGDVAFLILLGGPGTPGNEVLVEQVAAITKASGAEQATVDQQAALQRQVLDAVISGKGIEELQADLIKQTRAAAEQLPEPQRQALGDLDKWADQTVKSQFAALQSPWMKFFLTHDPAPVLEKVKAPVLALFGGKDTQVIAATNEPAVKAALQKGGNQNVTTKVFADANHLFQAAETGSPNEYTTLKPDFAPGVVDMITAWVVSQTN
jgi:uncharacterized protein